MAELKLADLVDLYDELPSETKQEIDTLLAEDVKAAPWRPLIDINDPSHPTPQEMAYYSEADILLYGGAAGGGKTSLGIGLALTAHKRSSIYRREGKQLTPIAEEIIRIMGTRKGYNSHLNRFNLPGRNIRLGGMQYEHDKKAYQGDDRDLYYFDEINQFLESQFRYVITWNRSPNPNQRCRVVATTNPPESSEGDWIVSFWAPWLDIHHPNPAAPGELRWFISDEEGNDREVDGPDPIPDPGKPGDFITPRSRTFIPSSVDDNPYYANSGYKASLQALPEPLRSQMLRGDFLAGREDDAWQVIPSEWVEKAMDRWTPEKPKGQSMSALGADPARGGRDRMILSPRYGNWFGELIAIKGRDVPDGPAAAAQCMVHVRDGAPINIDVIGGAGASTYDHLNVNGANVQPVDSRRASIRTDQSGQLGFYNERAENWWMLREALDPASGEDIALPQDREMKADLCAPKWKVVGKGEDRKIQVEGKYTEMQHGFGDLNKRLGRSPDKGDAVVNAWKEGPVKNPKPGSNKPKKANSEYNIFRKER